MKPPKKLFLIRTEYRGERDPGPPLTDLEWSEYMTKVERAFELFGQVVDLVAVGALTVEEYVEALDRLTKKSDELQPLRDRIAKEIDDSPGARELDRVATQYNLGLLKGSNAKPRRKKTFRSELERVFREEETRRSRRQESEKSAGNAARIPMDLASSEDVDR